MILYTEYEIWRIQWIRVSPNFLVSDPQLDWWLALQFEELHDFAMGLYPDNTGEEASSAWPPSPPVLCATTGAFDARSNGLLRVARSALEGTAHIMPQRALESVQYALHLAIKRL